MIEASIDAGLGDKVKAGMAVTAMVQTLDGPLQGTVREVFPAVDTLSRTFTVKVGLKDARPRSGLFARVRIPVGKREAILVPAKAVVWKGQLTGVYAVDGQGVITYRLVRAGNASAAVRRSCPVSLPGTGSLQTASNASSTGVSSPEGQGNDRDWDFRKDRQSIHPVETDATSRHRSPSSRDLCRDRHAREEEPQIIVPMVMSSSVTPGRRPKRWRNG